MSPYLCLRLKLQKVEYSDEDVDNVSLDLDTKEVLYMQMLGRPEDFRDIDRGVEGKYCIS